MVFIFEKPVWITEDATHVWSNAWKGYACMLHNSAMEVSLYITTLRSLIDGGCGIVEVVGKNLKN